MRVEVSDISRVYATACRPTSVRIRARGRPCWPRRDAVARLVANPTSLETTHDTPAPETTDAILERPCPRAPPLCRDRSRAGGPRASRAEPEGARRAARGRDGLLRRLLEPR